MIAERLDVGADVFRVAVEDPRFMATNCYVLIDGDEALVVDTGLASQKGAELVLGAFDELGLSSRRVSYFITHLHVDHVELLPLVAARGARVYVGARELRLGRECTAPERVEQTKRRILAAGIPEEEADSCASFAYPLAVEPLGGFDVVPVEDGGVVRVGGRVLTALLTPGHTPGHLCLCDPQAGFAFTGDHLLFDSSSYFGLTIPGEDMLQDYLEAMDRLVASGCAAALPGHGPAPGPLAERAGRLTAHRRGRLEEICGVLARSPGLSAAQLTRRLRWRIPADSWEEVGLAQRWVATSEVLTCLEHLVLTGCARGAPDDDGIVRYAPAS